VLIFGGVDDDSRAIPPLHERVYIGYIDNNDQGNNPGPGMWIQEQHHRRNRSNHSCSYSHGNNVSSQRQDNQFQAALRPWPLRNHCPLPTKRERERGRERGETGKGKRDIRQHTADRVQEPVNEAIKTQTAQHALLF
jgi:hypothetical protein